MHTPPRTEEPSQPEGENGRPAAGGIAADGGRRRGRPEARIAAGEDLPDLRGWVRRYVSMVLEAQRTTRVEEVLDRGLPQR